MIRTNVGVRRQIGKLQKKRRSDDTREATTDERERLFPPYANRELMGGALCKHAVGAIEAADEVTKSPEYVIPLTGLPSSPSLPNSQRVTH